MASGRRRTELRRRGFRAVELAGSVTLAWLVLVGVNLFNARLRPLAPEEVRVLVGSALVVAVAWVWAVWQLRRQLAAGKTLEELQALAPEAFEEWVAARFRDLGYRVELTGRQSDHGVDLVVERDGRRAVVQCKNYRTWSVGEPVLRDLFGAMHAEGADEAILVTTGRLTRAAEAWARGKPIEVWDGERLARLSRELAARGGGRETSVTPRATERGTDRTQGGGVETRAAVRCPKCGAALVERRNRRTGEPFLACPNYPGCRHTQPIAG